MSGSTRHHNVTAASEKDPDIVDNYMASRFVSDRYG